MTRNNESGRKEEEQQRGGKLLTPLYRLLRPKKRLSERGNFGEWERKEKKRYGGKELRKNEKKEKSGI